MYRSFQEIEEDVLAKKSGKKIVLMGSHDIYWLPALIKAQRKEMVSCVLVGDAKKTISYLNELGEKESNYEIIDSPNELATAAVSVELIRSGEADYPVKGQMQTSTFFRAIKESGLIPENSLISQVSAIEYKEQNRLLLVTDCAVNITPDYEDKKRIIVNAVEMARSLGITNPKVAVLSALELVNPKIPSTVHADALRAANQRGEIKECVVGGPLALDNAISLEAARVKGIADPVAGKADILVMPDLCSGNIFYKSLVFFSKMKAGGTFCGAKKAIIAASRTDTAENKYYAILLALLDA